MPDLKREPDPPVDIPQLSQGMEVFHRKFGKGIVETIEDEKLSVFFPERNETKRLALKFAFQSQLLRTVEQASCV